MRELFTPTFPDKSRLLVGQMYFLIKEHNDKHVKYVCHKHSEYLLLNLEICSGTKDLGKLQTDVSKIRLKTFKFNITKSSILLQLISIGDNVTVWFIGTR